MQPILEMRHHQDLPGRARARQCQSRGRARRDPRAGRRERRRQVDADEGALRRLPARHLRRRHRLRGRGRSSATSPTASIAASSSSTRSWRWCRSSRSPRTSSSATRSRPRASSTGRRPLAAPPRCSTRSACARRPTTLVADLGVGKQQLVEIAKALSKRVRLLILDEPTASLKENDSQALLDLLLECKAQGITSILISHKLNEISRVADRDHRAARRRHGRDARLPPRLSARTTSSATWSAARCLDRYPPRVPNIGEILFEVEGWNVLPSASTRPRAISTSTSTSAPARSSASPA